MKYSALIRSEINKQEYFFKGLLFWEVHLRIVGIFPEK